MAPNFLYAPQVVERSPPNSGQTGFPASCGISQDSWQGVDDVAKKKGHRLHQTMPFLDRKPECSHQNIPKPEANPLFWDGDPHETQMEPFVAFLK